MTTPRSAQAKPRTASDAATETGGLLQFIALEVKQQAFALPIASVMEFRTWIEPTPLPRSPFHVLGIINIRGEIVPVFDVGALLGFGRSTPTVWHVIILAETAREQVVGLLVDDVSDIIQCAAAHVAELPPDAADGLAVVQGVIEVGDSVLGVIDIDCLCSAERVIGVEVSPGRSLTALPALPIQDVRR